MADYNLNENINNNYNTVVYTEENVVIKATQPIKEGIPSKYYTYIITYNDHIIGHGSISYGGLKELNQKEIAPILQSFLKD